MTQYLLSIFAVLLSINAFCQTDSLFLNSNPEPILGTVSINYKKEKISINQRKNKPVNYSFNEVRRVSLSNGEVYKSHQLKSQFKLLLVLSEGKFSLLRNEHDKQFYIRKNDSLLVVSQAHFKRALPLIFGDEITDSYYTKSNVAPQYTASYLRRLTTYANEFYHSPETVYEQTISRFKTKLSVGPYIGFAYNRIAFDLYWENVKGISVYKKTDFYTSNSIPLGLSVDLAIFRKVSLRLDAYYSQTSNKHLDVDNMGDTKRAIPGSILHSSKYAPDVKFTGYSYKSTHFDLAAAYMPFGSDKNKLSLSVLAGPSIVVMNTNEMEIAVGYSETSQPPFQYLTGFAKLQRPLAMIGINAGLGAQYKINDRFGLRLSGKYVHGLFPKMINPGYSDKTENLAIMPVNAWEQVYHRFKNAYDQYTRIITISGSVYFQL